MADYELKDIRTDIIEPSQNVPVVIDFWAPWCQPCKTLSPILEKLAAQARGRWKFVKVNVDEPQNQPLASQFQIRSIPAVRMLFQGGITASFDGALPEAKVKEWLKENLPESEDDDEDDEQSGIEELIEKGEREKALQYARDLYNSNTSDEELKLSLSMLLLPDDIDTSGKLLNSLKEPEKYEIEKQSLETIKHLKSIAESGKVPGEDGNIADKYIKSAKALFSGNYEDALSGFIDIVMVNRSFDDDGARKACVAIFKMLGDKHPVTLQWRRRFSMALY